LISWLRKRVAKHVTLDIHGFIFIFGKRGCSAIAADAKRSANNGRTACLRASGCFDHSGVGGRATGG
jgi:hypothetical protein